jgi:hypothetical protein
LRRLLAHRVQEQHDAATQGIRAAVALGPGTRLIREWNGRNVREDAGEIVISIAGLFNLLDVEQDRLQSSQSLTLALRAAKVRRGRSWASFLAGQTGQGRRAARATRSLLAWSGRPWKQSTWFSPILTSRSLR